MKKILITPLILFILLPGTISCKRNHYKVNTSDIKVAIHIKRLEKDLFGINPDEIIPEVPVLKKKYGNFLQLFSYVINTGDINDSSFGDFLVRFCTDNEGLS